MTELALIMGFILLLWGNKLPDAVAGVLDFDPLYKKYASQYGLDWKLLKAIAQVESNENPLAKNPADPSYGLMQLLYPQKLNVDNWPPENVSMLYDPDYSVSIAAQILSWNIASFGKWRGVAVYNSWGARLDPERGPFRNQGYVDKVQGKYAALGG
jgi:soluble lytic murein transglycosylase-like protein